MAYLNNTFYKVSSLTKPIVIEELRDDLEEDDGCVNIQEAEAFVFGDQPALPEVVDIHF